MGRGSKSRQKREIKDRKQSEQTVNPYVDQANASICAIHPHRVTLYIDGEEEPRLCTYRRSLLKKLGQDGLKERSPFVVGDRVDAEPIGGRDGVVNGLQERRNYIARQAPGQEMAKIHVLAANLDRVVIVSSAAQPEFNPGLIDRFLVASQIAQILPLILVNKIDLWSPEKETKPKPWDAYRKLGFEILEISAKSGLEVERLRLQLDGLAALFCGHSGVGKTSLLRALTGQSELGEVGSVSGITGKGRHTTTGAQMVHHHQTSAWIDTPGIRSFGLVGIQARDLKSYFPEFSELECNERECDHVSEENCQAAQLYRQASYQRIYESMLEEQESS